MLAIILYVASTVARPTIGPPDRMVPNLGNDELLLNGCQQRLCFSQVQAEIADISKIIRLRNLHHIRDLTIAISARLHQPQDPSRPHHCERRYSTIIPLAP